MSNPTKLSVEQNLTTIRIERIFDAPQEKVFQAFSTRDKVAKWWSPFGTARVELFDTRPGGAWRIADAMEDNQEIVFFGYFHDVSFPERIVQTSEFANLPERGHVVLDRYEFRALAEARTLMILTEVFMSAEDRDAAVKSGMEPGIAQQYLNLDKLFSQGEW